MLGFDEGQQRVTTGAGQQVSAGDVDQVAGLLLGRQLLGVAYMDGAVEGLPPVAEFNRDAHRVHGHVGGAELGVVIVAVGAQHGREAARHGQALLGGIGVGVAGVKDRQQQRAGAAAATEHHEYWPCSVSLLDDELIDYSRLHGHRQVTDAYLLALAPTAAGSRLSISRFPLTLSATPAQLT